MGSLYESKIESMLADGPLIRSRDLRSMESLEHIYKSLRLRARLKNYRVGFTHLKRVLI